MSPRISRFPLHKPFEKLAPTSEMQQVVLRLVVGFNTEDAYIVGSATILCGHLLITARHVLEEIFRAEAVMARDGMELQKSLSAIQILPGPDYLVWPVLQCWLCPQTDIAFLNTASEPSSSAPERKVEWGQPAVRLNPPNLGEPVAAFGYRLSRISVTRNEDGGLHHDIRDELMSAVGLVREVYETHRDRSQMPFPSYRVGARFDGGMSGGPVFDERGAVCGIVCSSLPTDEPNAEPVSFCTTLWPMFLTLISANRGGNFPKDQKYPALHLIRNGFVHVADPEVLTQRFVGLV